MLDMATNSLLIESLLQLKRKPVAVKFLFSKEEFASFEANQKKGRIPYCSAVRNASMGKSLKLTEENFACPSAAMALGLVKPNSATISGLRRLRNGSYKDLCTSRSVSKSMIYCEHDIYGVGIIQVKEYRYKEDPDVVILISDSYDAMRIIQGYAYHYGHAKAIRMAGMQAICHECTSYPFETNDINISAMCSSARLLAQWARDEIGIGMPFNKFASVVDGIKNTVNPFERNRQKEIIEKALRANNLGDYLSIEYDKNYDDGGLIGSSSHHKDTD